MATTWIKKGEDVAVPDVVVVDVVRVVLVVVISVLETVPVLLRVDVV